MASTTPMATSAAVELATNRPEFQPTERVVSLCQWILTEKCTNVDRNVPSSSEYTKHQKVSLLRRVKVAYGIAELIRYSKRNGLGCFEDVSEMEGGLVEGEAREKCRKGCGLDNFAVRVSNTPEMMKEGGSKDGKDHAIGSHAVEGVDMIFPPLSLKFTTPHDPNTFLPGIGFDIDEEEELGGCVKVSISGVVRCIKKREGEEMNHSDDLSVDFQIDDFKEKVHLELDGQLALSENIDGMKKSRLNDDDSTICRLFGSSDGSGGEAPIAVAADHIGDNGEDNNDEVDDSSVCHLFGLLFYELLCNSHPMKEEAPQQKQFIQEPEAKRGIEEEKKETECMKEPVRKKTFVDTLSLDESARSNGASISAIGESLMLSKSPEMQLPNCTPLHAMGFPYSLSLIVIHLLDCGTDEFRSDDAYGSLKDASKDIYLLLRDPNLYLFKGHQVNSIHSSGKVSFKMRKNKTYGRKKEASIISETFCRVSFSGESEALFISGFAGSGKTRLAMNLQEDVVLAEGYFVSQKFDQMSRQNPLSAALAAFDSLCLIIRETTPTQELETIASELMKSFGTNLSALAHILPNILLIIPELKHMVTNDQQHSTINIKGVYFVIQRFMRVVSSTSRPVVLFLDDLQWADETSLGLVYSILSEAKGSNCFFFVGSYRDTEIEAGHSLFQMMDTLEARHVNCTKLNLDGMPRDGVNLMVSESLGVLPRLSQSLSDTIFRKTKGSPLFVIEFLHLLVDQGLLRFSLRERRWLWDEDSISELSVADNVCDLLSAKISILPTAMQSALKIASCFGMKVDSNVVACLSASNQYSNLDQDMEELVEEGFIDKNEACYKFAHDKVRESSYGLIPVEQRHQFHLDLGMLLLENFESSGYVKDETVFAIADQINHCQLSLLCDSQRLKIAELNYRAGKRAMTESNFTAARYYGVVSSTLLPADHWTSLYDLSRKICHLSANAAFSCGLIDEASNALNAIINNANCTEDKLDAYFSMTLLLQSCQETGKAFDICINVLCLLGENIPTSVDTSEIFTRIMKVQQSLMSMTREELLGVKEMNSSVHFLLVKFYSQACFVSYFAKPQMLQYFVCKLVELSLEHGLCKYSSFGLAVIGMLLCSKMVNQPSLGYKLGKVAMDLLQRDGAADQSPRVYLVFYNFIAVHFEPLQSCVDMLHQGFQIGMSVGDNASGFLCGIQTIQKSLVCGSFLPDLKKEADYFQRVFQEHSHSLTAMYMTLCKQTLSVLINNGGSKDFDKVAANHAAKVTAYSETLLVHQAMQAFWLGHYERCHHLAEKFPIHDMGKLSPFVLLFYRAIAALRLVKKAKKVSFYETAVTCINEMKLASENSKWNYANKLFLIEAELYSSEGNYAMAGEKYDAAIQAARDSKFIHEQGLASEFAGIHYSKGGEFDRALNFLSQAKQCYIEWGSQMKVDRINEKIEELRLKAKK